MSDDLEMMTSPLDDDEVDVVDFSISRKSKVFRLEDDVFHAYPMIPIPAMQIMMRAAREMGAAFNEEAATDDAIASLTSKIGDMFNALLPAAEAKIMRDRLASSDGRVAVDLRQQVMPIINWLMGKYGLRPTEPPAESSTGLPAGGTGTGSTAGAQPEESTQPN